MLRYYNLSKNNYFYYDLDNKTIARFPTKSNLSLHGSDNSLYFGMISNEEVYELFCNFFTVKDLNAINGKDYEMKCGIDDVKVVFNINAQGQIQIKIKNDGTMGRLANNYAFEKMKNIDFTKMLIVVDFLKMEIRFKDPSELEL